MKTVIENGSRLGVPAAFALVMLLGVAGPCLGADPAAPPLEIEGWVISNSGDAVVVRDAAGKTTEVLLSDMTDVKSKNPGLGVIRKGKHYAAEALVPGLEVEVEGTARVDGKLVADKVRFGKKDLQMAQAIQAGVAPVGEQAAATEAQAAATAAQVGDITNMDVRQQATVNFAVDSTALSAEAKRVLDQIAANAKGIAKGFVIEVRGFADSSGDAAHNMELSKKRAEAVTSYLQVQHDIPLRQIVSPAGYGDTHAAADNTTEAGRAANRRVEVKLLASKGLQQPS